MGRSSISASAASLGGATAREFFRAVLDLVPTPIVLVEDGTGTVTFANQAADRLAGGTFPRGNAAERYAQVPSTDEWGLPIPVEDLPSARVARGERVEGARVEWHLSHRTASLLASADTVTDPDGLRVGVIAFEDVTEMRAVERMKDESLALLDTIFESAPVGLAFSDHDLRYVRVNEALARMNGLPLGEHVGRTVPEVVPEMEPAFADGFRRVIESEEPVVGVEVRGRTAASDDERTWLCSWYPVRDRVEGRVLGIGSVVTEITERDLLLESERRARRRAELAESKAAFLAQAGEVLASSLEHERTLAEIVRIAVPAKADWCAVDLLEPDGRIRRLAAYPAVDAGGDGDGALLPGLGDAIGPAAVIRSGRPELHPDVAALSGPRGGEDRHLRLLRALGATSTMTVPLVVRGRPAGALSFALLQTGRAYTRESLALVMEVARRASTAMEQSLLYQERDHIAQTLQRSLLPHRLPDLPGYEVAARYRAAGEGYDVGGDFYDMFETRGSAWAIVMGDVCGKGPEAASLTSLARYTVRTGAAMETLPSGVLQVTNEGIRRDRTDDRFLTAVYAHLDPATGALVTANAGHPPMLVLRADRTVEQVAPRGPVLGVIAGAAYVDERIELAPGDAIVMYTDGVLDAGAPDRLLRPAELARIASAHADGPAAELADAIERGALEAAAGSPRDDIAVLVLRRDPA